MIEAAENRLRDDPHFPGEIMAGDQCGRQPGRGLRAAGAEAAAGASPVIMQVLEAKSPPQRLLPDRNQAVQTRSP